MTKTRMLITFCTLVLCGALPTMAQNTAASAISQLLPQLQDANSTVRSSAFYSLLELGSGPNTSTVPYDVPLKIASLLSENPGQAVEVHAALINLLLLENPNISAGYQETDQPQITEQQTEYYADLVAAIASLQDPGAINSLVGSVLTGDIAISALGAFGDPAADPLIQQLTSATDDLTQFSSLLALERMLDPSNFPNISSATQLKLRQAFEFASSLSDPDTANEAQQALNKLNSLAPTDTLPPVTLASISPSPNASGWNNTNVVVTLNSTDKEPGGSGVKQITYSANGAQGMVSTVVSGSLASLAITAEGITTVTFFGIDNAGNVEVPKSLLTMLDKTPPTVTGTPSPAPNANGWNNTNVTVSFQCTDGLSGLAAGSPPAPTSLSGEGAGQSVTGTCIDLAGNSASVTVSGIKIDKTPPVVACSASPDILWPPNNKLVPINVSVTVTDALSGSAGFRLVSVTSNEPDSGLGDIQRFVTGTASTSGQLRAERLGSGNGRVYTFTYSGSDKAGNTASCTTAVTVPHDQGNN
jgi:hypothetical protein